MRLTPMKIDNEMYFRKDYDWWDPSDDSTNALLRRIINPIRFAYFTRVSRERLGEPKPGQRILEVGSGGGFLAEEFARIGFDVTGIDPAERSILSARAHARKSNLRIDYREGHGEALPFESSSFDFVACCDVLEHVDDLTKVIREIARVLRSGGLFFYDTVNRTFFAWLLVIKVAQDWKLTAWEEPRTHAWRKFVKPSELCDAMRGAGLLNQETKGICSRASLLSGLRNVRRRARGEITRLEMSTRLQLFEGDAVSTSYMGWAVRT